LAKKSPKKENIPFATNFPISKLVSDSRISDIIFTSSELFQILTVERHAANRLIAEKG